MVKVGLRAQNWPNELEKIILIQHIKENFGGNTVEEIKLAFDMAISGRLRLDEKEINCYENFSCLYFSKIMNAYRDWSVDAIVTVPRKQEDQKIFTQQELDDSAREDAERQYQLFLRKYELKGLEFNKEILIKDGLIKESESVMQFFIRKATEGKANIYKRG